MGQPKPAAELQPAVGAVEAPKAKVVRSNSFGRRPVARSASFGRRGARCTVKADEMPTPQAAEEEEDDEYYEDDFEDDFEYDIDVLTGRPVWLLEAEAALAELIATDE